MFTGLIEDVGRLTTGVTTTDGGRVTVETRLAPDLGLGDSIAVNGICLTVVGTSADAFDADVSPQTARVTTAAHWRSGRRVNLERPLRAGAELGGHFVLGHVDGVSQLLARRQDGDSYWLEWSLPAAIAPLVIPRGSIALDGISLTVAELGADRCAVQIIPHTWAVTTLSDLAIGDDVNVEADVLGKHVARLMEFGRGSVS
jgi:riboflavin synthase